jgi:hypothetical protein
MPANFAPPRSLGQGEEDGVRRRIAPTCIPLPARHDCSALPVSLSVGYGQRWTNLCISVAVHGIKQAERIAVLTKELLTQPQKNL